MLHFLTLGGLVTNKLVLNGVKYLYFSLYALTICILQKLFIVLRVYLALTVLLKIKTHFNYFTAKTSWRNGREIVLRFYLALTVLLKIKIHFNNFTAKIPGEILPGNNAKSLCLSLKVIDNYA